MPVQGAWNLDDLIEEYQRHQRKARGLSETTLRGYEQIQRQFVRAALGEDPVHPGRLRATDVIEFATSMSARWSPRSMKAVRTALRSLFRFLRLQGIGDERLELAIPPPAHWRLSGLPRHLSGEELTRVLASLETSTPCGPRNRAIVLCLATLGLRPGEVAGLRLEDIDWRDGTIRIRARKNHRGAVLPLPREAGEAMADYLRGHRPETTRRRVFVQQIGLVAASRSEPMPCRLWSWARCGEPGSTRPSPAPMCSGTRWRAGWSRQERA
jgi:integrase